MGRVNNRLCLQHVCSQTSKWYICTMKIAYSTEAISTSRCHLTSIYPYGHKDNLTAILLPQFPILIRQHLYIENDPRNLRKLIITSLIHQITLIFVYERDPWFCIRWGIGPTSGIKAYIPLDRSTRTSVSPLYNNHNLERSKTTSNWQIDGLMQKEM